MSNEEDNSIIDGFFSTPFFSADALFSFSLQPVDEIKGDCLVVLDTNVLLLPYRTGKTALDHISSIYGQLIEQKRLVIPGQVAREFAKNRGQKISELFQKISIKRNKAGRLIRDDYPLLESLKQYKDMMSLEEEINKTFSRYRKSIEKLLEEIHSWQWNDPVAKLYKELFSKDVVFDVSIDDNEIQKDLVRRNKHKIPPGYKDAAKPDSGIGDLIIWHTILSIAHQRKKSVIFVSGEEKADWQIRSENESLYPRYELVDEFRRHTRGASFHMQSFSKFLGLFGAGDRVVAEISEKEMQEGEIGFDSNTAKQGISFDALLEWLQGNYPEQYVITGGGNVDSADIEIVYSDNSKIGVDVIIGSSLITHEYLNNIFDKKSALVKANQYKSLIIAIITQISSQELNILHLIDDNKIRVAPNVALLVGHVSSNFMFRMVYFA